MSARDYMVFKPEDLTTEELHYELLLRHEIINNQSRRQLTVTLNQMMAEEQNNPEFYDMLRSHMLYTEEEPIIVAAYNELIEQFKAIVTFEALQRLISRTFHYSSRVTRMTAGTEDEKAFREIYHDRFQRLLRNLEASILIGRNGPNVHIDLSNIPEFTSTLDLDESHASLNNTNGSVMGRMSMSMPTISNTHLSDSVTEVITSSSNNGSNANDVPEVSKANDLISFGTNILQPNASSNNVPPVSNSSIEFTPSHNSSVSKQTARSTTAHDSTVQSVKVSEINDLESKQKSLERSLVEWKEEAHKESNAIKEQVTQLNGKLDTLQNQLGEVVSLFSGNGLNELQGILSMIKNMSNVGTESNSNSSTTGTPLRPTKSFTSTQMNSRTPIHPMYNCLDSNPRVTQCYTTSIPTVTTSTTTVTAVSNTITGSNLCNYMNNVYTPLYPILPVTDSFRSYGNNVQPVSSYASYHTIPHFQPNKQLSFHPSVDANSNNNGSWQNSHSSAHIQSSIPCNYQNSQFNYRTNAPVHTSDGMQYISHANNSNFNDRKFYSLPIHKWNIRFSGMMNCKELKREEIELDSYEFIDQVIRMRDSERITNDELLGRISCLLIGTAKTWYRAYYREFTTWEIFEKNFREQFQRDDIEVVIRRKMQETIQGKDESPSNFMLRMLVLANKIGDRIDETEKISYVINGLQDSIAYPIRLFKPQTITDLKRLILNADRQEIKVDRPNAEPSQESVRKFQYNSYYNKSKYRQPFAKQANEIEDRKQNSSHENSESSDSDDNVSELSFVVDANEADTVKMKSIHEYKNKFSRNGKDYSRNQNGKLFYCYNCGIPGHTHATCREDRKLFCYGCGQIGLHTLDCNCPRSQKFRATHSKNSSAMGNQPPDPKAGQR